MKHATPSHDRSSRIAWIGGLVPLGIIAAVALSSGGGRAVLAADTTSYDSDGDGLPDAQELVLKSDPNSADTDGDGVADGIEFARQSDPLSATSIPTVDFSLRVDAHSTEGFVHILTAIYADDGQFGSHALRFGSIVNGRPRSIDAAMMSSARVEKLGNLLVIDWAVPAARMEKIAGFSFFAALARGSSVAYDSAAVVDLRSSRRIVFRRNTDAANRGGPGGPGENDSDVIGMSMSATGGTSVGSLPLPTGRGAGPGATPRESEPGSICELTSIMVGGNSGMVEHEVVSAECVDGFDAFCDVECFDNVGRTYWSVDPIVIVGG